MTDKVDAIMEDMVPELNHYKNESYFTDEEVRMIVKERKQDELIISMSAHGKSLFNTLILLFLFNLLI